MAVLSDWNVIKEFSDAKIDNKDGIRINSEVFTQAKDNVFSHFKAFLFYKNSFSITETNEFTWTVSGNTFLKNASEQKRTSIKGILSRTNNVFADPRIASAGVLLVDSTNSLLFGFLITQQVIYVISGRHPIPPLETFKEWRQRATLDEYVRFIAFGEHQNASEIPWMIWIKRYDPLDYKQDWESWKKVGMEPDYWADWCVFRSSGETHMALIQVYSRASEDEEVNLTISLDPAGSVTYRVNDVNVFEQVRLGVKLLDKYRAVDTGAVNLAPESLRVTPVIGTFSWIDLFDPENKQQPFVALAPRYLCPVANKLGEQRKLSRRKFLAKHSTQAQLFGQGALLIVKSYLFGPPDTFTKNIKLIKPEELEVNLDFRDEDAEPTEVEVVEVIQGESDESDESDDEEVYIYDD